MYIAFECRTTFHGNEKRVSAVGKPKNRRTRIGQHKINYSVKPKRGFSEKMYST